MGVKHMKKGQNLEYLGLGIFAVIGFVLGLALFLLLYNWYLVGFADSTTVLTTGVILALIMYVIVIFAYKLGQKYGHASQKAIFYGIGFTIALIIATVILGWLSMSASVTVSAVVVTQRLSMPKRIKGK